MPDPGSIGEVLRKIASKLGIDHPAETARLFAAWEQIVGREVAARCEPESLRGGVLKVRTDSAAWASELRYLAPEIESRINRELGREVVTEVKASVGPRRASGFSEGVRERQLHPPPQEPPGNPRQEPEGSGREDTVEEPLQIADDKLREATKRALLAAKMKKRGG